MPFKKKPQYKPKKLTPAQREDARAEAAKREEEWQARHIPVIISIGYFFIITDAIKEMIYDYLDRMSIDRSNYEIIDEVYFGTKYGMQCRGGIQRSNVAATQKEMEQWYTKNKNKITEGTIKSIWIIRKPNVIGVRIAIASQYHYAFLAKTSEKMSTTYFKRMFNAGVKPTFDNISLQVQLHPYCHKQ